MSSSMDNDAEAVNNLNNSLKYLQKLKVTLHSLFDSLGNGPTEGQENASYLRGIQQRLINMDAAFTDLDNSGNMLPSSNPLPSTNSMSIPLEPEDENYEMFHQLINSYTWSKRMQEYSSCVNSLLKENQLKRIGPSSGYIGSKRPRKPNVEAHSVQASAMDGVLMRLNQSIAQKYPDTVLLINRPIGISTVLVLTIGKILKAVIVFRGMLTERVTVMGYDEPHTLDNGEVDIWGESKFKVFQLVTHCAQAANLHLHSSIFPEMSLYSLVHWLHNYSGLFSDPCNYCQKILNNCLPPTGRGFEKTPTRYHIQCASSQAK